MSPLVRKIMIYEIIAIVFLCFMLYLKYSKKTVYVPQQQTYDPISS